MEFVSIDVTDGVAVLRLDRPKMNAISIQVQADLREAAAELGERDDVRAVVMWGGERVFAAGNDVKEMADLTYSDMVKVSASVSSATTAIARIPKPVIAAVNGYALGGGCELALSADLRFAAEDAVFGQPEVLLGIIPGAGGTQRLPRAVGKAKAMDLVLTGRMMDAVEVERAGLVSRVVPAADLLDTALAAAETICGMSGPSVMMAKEAIDQAYETPLTVGIAYERRMFHSLFGTEDKDEGMKAFLEKRKAEFRHR